MASNAHHRFNPAIPEDPSRRRLVLGSVAGLVGVGLTGLAPAVSARADTVPIGKADYDAMALALASRTRAANDEGGSWSWGWSQLLLSYLPMFERYGDLTYLDLFIADADRLLAARDSTRGVTDYLGRSLPWWRTGGRYATGAATIPTAQGQVQLRIGVKGNSAGVAGTAVVSPTSDGRFDLTVVDQTGNKTDTFTGLSLDRTSADYVVDRLYWAEPNVTKTTVKDLRTTPSPDDTLTAGTHTLVSEWYVSLVGTGVLTTPLARFARTVRQTPGLSSTYRDAADRYLTAALDAVACHEPEWDGHGTYRMDVDGPSISPGADWPHNQNLAIATTFLHVAEATTDRTTAARAKLRACQLLRRFRSDLELQGSAYVWSYWCRSDLGYRGWTREDQVSARIPYWKPYQSREDSSHAYLDILAMAEGHRVAQAFTATEMQRFANTFADTVATTDAAGGPITYDYLGRVGGLGAYDSRAGAWALVAPWRSEILPFLDDLFRARSYVPQFGYPPLSLAFLAAAERP